MLKYLAKISTDQNDLLRRITSLEQKFESFSTVEKSLPTLTTDSVFNLPGFPLSDEQELLEFDDEISNEAERTYFVCFK